MNTANRLLGVLGLFTVEKSEWTVEEAAKEIGVSISTAYRYFRDLCKIGLLDPFPGGKYILGPAVIENDRKIRLTDPLIKVGRPAMERLVVRSGSLGVAVLCRIYRHCVMCVHQEARILPEISVGYERGRPMPMFQGASSKVIFANLPSRQARWFFEKYAGEIAAAGLGSDWEGIKVTLRQIRKAGVYVTHGEVDSGRVGIAAPVFGPDGIVIGSIAMVIPQTEATPQFIANVSALVQAAGREIDAGLRLLSSGEIVPDPGQPPMYHETSNSETAGTARASERS
ncbi:MAG: helix-turn-helix domain-containing protein [Acidobacteriia bacterium]|nr:helix-turn-helix domain-containing protein [Terriglobia bacterium]